MSAIERWWGWWGSGGRDRSPTLSESQLRMLSEQLGALRPWPHPDSPAEVSIPAAEPVADRFRGELDIEATDTHDQRVLHATGRGYVDLARIRERRLEHAPDLVVHPADAEEVAAVLAWCSANAVAVVPFGGGTSVVGGIEALRGRNRAVVSLDLARLKEVEIDPVSRRASLGAGLRGPEAEAALASSGLTLGHFPQSYEQATIGGYAATRSAGQASTGWGRFDAVVAGLEMVTPDGSKLTSRHAHTAAGPSLGETALGSEGAFGVITRVTARVGAAPVSRRYEGWMLDSFDSGAEAVRSFMQAGVRPDVVRLSDRNETAVSVASSEASEALRALRQAYLTLRGRKEGCLLVLGFEGSSGDVAVRRSAMASILRGHGGVYLGTGPGKSWERGRFEGPFHRDALMDLGVMVETFETARPWSGLMDLHAGVGTALSETLGQWGEPGIVMCHLSHAYQDGASLYFTVICPARQEAPIEQWRELKTAAGEAITRHGGTITHHHAVGTDHLPWMVDEVGEAGAAVLSGLKQSFDPGGIMNPGKLIPPVA